MTDPHPPHTPQTTDRSWLQRYRVHLLWVSVWVALVGTFYLTVSTRDTTTKEMVVGIFEAMTTFWWAPLIFLGAYMIRPLLFIPVTLFALSSGLFFGLWWGIPLALCGAVISGAVAHYVGRLLRGQGISSTPDISDSPSRTRYMLAHRPFEVILGLHLTLLPFDMVNYTSGLLRVHTPSVLGGIALGLLPGTISMVSIGAGIDFERFLADGFSVSLIDWRYMLLALAVFIIATTTSHIYRRSRAY